MKNCNDILADFSKICSCSCRASNKKGLRTIRSADLGGGCGIRTHVPRGQTVFKTSYSRGQFRLLYGDLAHFGSLKILIPQGFLPRFEPFEPKSNRIESNGISKNLSKISHFRENLERT